MSDLIQRFAAYAQAFEEAYADDNWSRLEPHFAHNAVYLPGDGTAAIGRDAVLATLRESVNALDRQFEHRKLELHSAPKVENDLVTLRWRVSYSDDALQDLVISGTELATFYDGAIQRLEDIFDEEAIEALNRWVAQAKRP